MSLDHPGRKIPVILDTDIGGDIDDTWALAMLLNSPELDVKLVLTEDGNTVYRAMIAAKMLEAAGRADIPVGIGIRTSDEIGPQGGWVEGYDLGRYPGMVQKDGVGAMIDVINASKEQVTLISIAALGNIASALERAPGIALKTRFVGMQGSIRKGYRGADAIDAEANVEADPKACQMVFAAPWSVTITPLDTCGIVTLKGDKYQRVLNCKKPLAQAVMENYRFWWSLHHGRVAYPEKYLAESSVLFDTVAVYLAFSEELLSMEELGVRVTDDGYTLIDGTAKKLRCATAWKDIGSFEDLLAQRLTGGA